MKIGWFKRNLVMKAVRPKTRYLLAIAMFLVFVDRAHAVDISDIPLETQFKTEAAANLMFVLDNSGSMDAEFLTSEDDGLFGGRFYLFADGSYFPAIDHTFGAGNALTMAMRFRWRSQWSGVNKVFYDPSRFYRPWPSTAGRNLVPADLHQPFSNPVATDAQGARLRMTDTFFTVSGGLTTITVLNAHYFTVLDANANGRVDPGEPVYLVTWADDDGDNQLDIGGAGNDRRLFYRFMDDGDDMVEDGELQPVTDEEEKNLVRPRVSGESGENRRLKTDAEDLQNFVNWFTYHRRREFAAKAVVAAAVAGLKNVSIGYYAINDAPRIAVRPVKPADGNIIVVDNQDDGFATSGVWLESDTTPEWSGSAVFTRQEGATASFRPDLPVAARYRVSAWWPCSADRDRRARYEVGFAGGTQTAVVEKDQSDGGTSGCGQWVELGVWDFTAGTDNVVQVVRTGDSSRNGSSTAADALRFENLDATASRSADGTDFLLDTLYDLDSDGTTPLRSALDQVGRYFDQGSASPLGPSPFADEERGGGCQRAYAIVLTDGFWNGTFTGVGNADGTKGSPFTDTASETLADIAMHYHETDLAPGLPDLVPRKGCDDAPHQHMTTYSISFGVDGTIDIADIDNDGQPDDPSYRGDPCFDDADTPRPAWPAPTPGTRTTIDDVWHAAVNGRGLYLQADDPAGLMTALNDILADIDEPSSAATATVGGDLLTSDSAVFQTRYRSDSWTGEVLAFTFDQFSGEVEDTPGSEVWNAADRLNQPGVNFDNRRIVSFGGLFQPPRGIALRYDDLSNDQKTSLGSDLTPDSGKDREARNLLDFIRGREIPGLRRRDSKLGDIVHSASLLVGGTLFVGANDGMLHAFDALTGDERFAYVPHLVFANLKALGSPDYNQNHRFFVDATPFAGEVDVGPLQRNTYLVGGLGKGGKGYFVLLAGTSTRTQAGGALGPFNVTFSVDDFGPGTPESDVSRIVQWEYPRPDPAGDGMDNDGDGRTDESGEFDPDIGFSFGQGFAVNANTPTGTFRPVVIFSNGYNSFSGKAVLYVLDAVTGVLVRKIDTGVAGDNGLSIPAIIDANLDQKVDYVYAGDLKGNVWKFDLTSDDPARWGVAYGEDLDGDGVIDAADEDLPRPLFQARNQAITGRPDVMFASSACAVQAPGFLVIVGTGKFLGQSDLADTGLQSIYGLWDFGDDSDDTEFLGALEDRNTGRLTSGFNLVREEIVVTTGTDGSIGRKLTNTTIDFSSQDDDTDADGSGANNRNAPREANPVATAGWFIDFPQPRADDADPGERVTSNVTIRGGSAVVVSFAPSNAPCTGGGTSRIYLVNGCLNDNLTQGLGPASGVTRLDGRVSNNPVIVKSASKLHTDLIMLSTSTGRILPLEILGESWGKVFWRQNLQE